MSELINSNLVLDEDVRPRGKNEYCRDIWPGDGAWFRYYASKPNAPGTARFARLFRETWGRMPPYASRAISRHWGWELDDARIRGIYVSPDILFASDWEGKEPGTMGCAACGGHILRFDSRRISKMPDEIVRDLIAHELAHVFQWIIGENMNLLESDEDEIEASAGEIAEHWGFDPESFYIWVLNA